MAICRLTLCTVLLGCLPFASLARNLEAQNTIPSGTIIPVELRSKIDSQKSNPGQPIVAAVAQDVPFGEKRTIHRKSKVLGRIVQIESTSGRATLSLRFDSIELGHTRIPISTQLRALADYLSIQAAQLPTNAVDDAWFSSAWTTVQIGGDAVYHGGGPVQSPTGEIVGKPTDCVECGVLDTVKSIPGPNCTGAVADDTHPQAMWMFSADACGVYGFNDLQFQNGSTISRDGQILFSADKRVKLPAGTALLLTVTGSKPDTGKADTGR